MKNLPAVEPGDVVVVDFPGVEELKRRPAVVVSSDTYHAGRPDAILGVITTNVAAATCDTDHTLLDWEKGAFTNPPRSAPSC